MRKKLTQKIVKKMMKDELEGVKEYKKYGLNEFAADEKSHYNHLKKILIKLK